MKHVIIFCAAVGLFGCVANQSDSSQVDLAAADTVEFMRPYELSRTDVTVISMGPVEGRSCQSNLFDQKPSQEEAILLLKVAAAENNANRVVLRSCRQEATDACRASWVCEGQAYQVQPLR